MNGGVSALAVSGNDVYAAGWFTTAGGEAANFIAKWNGTSWSALGSGMNNSVNALAVSGSDVYAGGNFTEAGGVAVNRIAKWNGTSWSALETGVSGTVSAVAVSGSDVFAGGVFEAAGSGGCFVRLVTGPVFPTADVPPTPCDEDCPDTEYPRFALMCSALAFNADGRGYCLEPLNPTAIPYASLRKIQDYGRKLRLGGHAVGERMAKPFSKKILDRGENNVVTNIRNPNLANIHPVVIHLKP